MQTIGGALAFVPHPLPPDLDQARLLPVLAEAAESIGELRGIGRTLPNAYLLVRPLQRREAVASSNIEGTYTNLSDLFMFEAGADDKARPPDTREVANYVKALEASITRLKDIPVSLRLIREAHALLMSGTKQDRGAKIVPGEFRTEQNWIGSRRDTVKTARFVPPPPDAMQQALNDLENYINEDDGLHPLIRLALIHYQFETIHPFPDGNGRVGRLLIPLVLHERGVLTQPLLYLSPYLEKHRDAYIDALYEVSRTGAWIEWIQFFLRTVVAQCRDTIQRVQHLQELQVAYRARLRKAHGSMHVLTLADRLFESPFITVPRAQKLLGLTYRGAQLNVEKLVAAGVLVELPESHPKFYVAAEILELVQREAEA